VTEEVWSWWQEGSVHRQRWPEADALAAIAAGADGAVFDLAASVLYSVRKAKSSANRGMRTEVDLLRVQDTAPRLALLGLVERDLCDAGVVGKFEMTEGPDPAVTVELAAPAPAG
jgi:valyl-tRNA synthetase